MPIYFVTATGPQPIPEAIVSQGGAAVDAYIAKQGWQPPPPPGAAAPSSASVPTADPDPAPPEET